MTYEGDPDTLLPYIHDGWSAMLFVDGENLAIRVASLANQRGVPLRTAAIGAPLLVGTF